MADYDPKLITLVSDAYPNLKLPDYLADKYAADPFFKLILKDPSQFKNFEVHDGFIFMISHGDRLLCIPNASFEGRAIREIIISHAHTLLAHLGNYKTAAYLRAQAWWKTMVKDISDFCETCPTCAMTKARTQVPYGRLSTLPVPTRPWQQIGIDFLGPLPESKNRTGLFDMITVVIDHLSGYVHLVATKQTYKARDVAEVVFDSVYKLHGLPEKIISDRDSLFTSAFWKHLHQLIGVDLRLSTAYHPQTDGATERANRTIVQMLRQCVSLSQKDWAVKLPAIEFAVNLATRETTGYSPFELVNGRKPPPMLIESVSEYNGVRTFARKTDLAIMDAHNAIIHARSLQTHQANRHRQISPFRKGSLVFVSTADFSIPKGRARKLIPKYFGPVPDH